MDIKVLRRQGVSIRGIARQTGLSRATIRRVLGQVAPKRYGPRSPRPGKLTPHLKQLDDLHKLHPSSPATVLYEAITKDGYAGHYERVKCWLRERRREEMASRRACVRFETAPGVEGQFDWKGPVRGLIASDPAIDVHFFRFLLGWSRARWTLVVRSLKLPAVLASLNWAFEKAGGVPARLVFDNPKTMVLKPKPHLELHSFFSDFCRHYGCEPDPAWPYYPERKGKTERSFRDLADAGILDETYPSLAALQQAVTVLDESRMARINATIGERPCDRLLREREELQPLPSILFDPRLPEIRRVFRDCTVSYLAARYSVPNRLVGSRVVVKLDPLDEHLEIFAGIEKVAEHRRVGRGQRSILEDHVADLRRPRLERIRERACRGKRSTKRHIELLSPITWSAPDVELRPIEEYAAVVGGGR